MKPWDVICTVLLGWVTLVLWAITIPFSANFIEPLVHEYTLPSVLNGVDTAANWEADRRPELLNFFQENVYGPIPKESVEVKAETLEEGDAFPGTDHEARRKQVAYTLSRDGHSVTLHVLEYIPVQCVDTGNPNQTKCPAVISLNFFGNQSVTHDPDVLPSVVWSMLVQGTKVPFKESSRASHYSHFPIENIIKDGYAAITVYYGDVEPDFNGGAAYGAHALFPEYDTHSWGSVSAWAWGMERVMDYVQNEKSIDNSRVVLFGFSRLGKSALWAAANDSRFAAVISDSAGEGGDTLSHRNFGETIRLMTLRFPYWFNSTYRTYSMHESELPIDQHELLALIAPRPLLVSAGTGDWWSDHTGEGLATEAAMPAYGLYSISDMPTFYLHSGGHEVTLEEWKRYLNFFDTNL